jgi:MFS family permease
MIPTSAEVAFPPAELRRARIGTVLTFALAAAISAVWIVRTPALVDKLDLDPSKLGIVVLFWGGGALITMQFTQRIVARIGTRKTLRIAGPASTVTLAPIGLATTYPWLLAASALFGMAFGVLDISMNTHSAALERAYERHLMNGMHAGWSMGAVLGGIAGSLTAAAGLSFAASVVGAAVVATPLAVALGPTYLATGQETPDTPRRRGRLPGIAYFVGGIAFAAFMVEGSVADWSGIHMNDDLHASQSLAALAYPAFELGALGGRLVGDRVRAAIGTRTLVSASGLATAAAFVLVVTTGSAGVGLVGYLLIGIAVCAVAPIAFSLAGDIDPTRAAASIALAGTLGYTGLLLGPVVIGLLADATTLRGALFVAVGLGLAIAVAGRLLPKQWRVRGHDARADEAHTTAGGDPARDGT